MKDPVLTPPAPQAQLDLEAGGGSAPAAGGEGSRAASTRVARNSFWLIAQPLLMNAIAIVSTAYIARTLGPEDYGRFVTALAFIAMFVPVTNLGLRFVTIRDLASGTYVRAGASPGPEEMGSYVGRMLVLRLLLGLACAVVALAAVGVSGGSEETVRVTQIASAIIVLQAASSAFNDVFQAFEAMKLVARVQFVMGLFIIGSSVSALLLGLGLYGLMGAYVLGNLLGTTIWIWHVRARGIVPRLSIDVPFWRRSLLVAAPLFFPNLVREAGTRFGVVLLGRFSGQHAVGTFGAANNLLDRLVVIPDGVCTALFPTLSGAYARSREVAGKIYRTFFRLFLVVGLPIAVGTTVLAEPITYLIFGREYENTPLALAILAWGLFLNFLAYLQGWTVAAIRQERRGFFVPIACTAAYLGLAVALMPGFQEIGLAVATLALPGVSFLLFRPIIREHLVARVVEPALVLKIVAASVIMGGVTWMVRGWPVWLSIPAGAATYAGATLALGAMRLSEIREILASMRGRSGASP